MSGGHNIMLVVAALGTGFALAWSVRGEQLLECRATLHAADLSQEGSEHLMVACLDQQEQLDVCELGQEAAAKVLDELQRQYTLAQAHVLVLRKKCESPDEEKP